MWYCGLTFLVLWLVWCAFVPLQKRLPHTRIIEHGKYSVGNQICCCLFSASPVFFPMIGGWITCKMLVFLLLVLVEQAEHLKCKRESDRISEAWMSS